MGLNENVTHYERKKDFTGTQWDKVHKGKSSEALSNEVPKQKQNTQSANAGS